MNRFVITIMVACLLPPIAMAQTQSEMNLQSYQDFATADKELNRLYQQILRHNAEDAVFSEKFKAAENAWIAYRDAMVDAQFPINAGDAPKNKYGSIYPVCEAGARQRLTEEHIRELKQWLAAIEEGELCAGSRGVLLTN